ncbi:hypothetical protein H4R18_000250 [Coemansia javaensis]|uniref:F-box domain-containing protein n=1 Tax=Coemansia javaensis TaxID=2761396 RepID=A0A9W8LNA9_9FUNG|nr:hypothetical protein H4R18_000250 [Coemansia javaensis]
MLDRLPDGALQLVVRYLRSWDYRQDDLLALSQVCRALRRPAIRRVWEYFTLTDVVATGQFARFAAVQPNLSRLLVADDEALTDEQWERALERLEQMGWTHVTMFSIELDAIRRQSTRCAERILAFVHQKLGHVREQWVGLTDDRAIADRFFAHRFGAIRELRIIGKPMDAAAAAGPAQGGPAAPRLQIPAYSDLSVVYLDGTAAGLTSIVEVVRRSHQSLRDLNVDEFTARLAGELGLRPGAARLEYPRLQRLAVSNRSYEETDALLDGSRMPALTSLYFSESMYPSFGGVNFAATSAQVRLMGGVWPSVRCLAVDGLSRGDVALVGERMPTLQILSIGALGSDIPLGDPSTPSVPADLATVGVLLDTCPTLADLRIETPEEYEDMYNNSPAFAAHYSECFPEREGEMPSFERPFDPTVLHIASKTHTALRSLTLNSWALTFDQLILLLGRLPQLNSLEGILHFTSRFQVTQRLPQKHQHLARLGLAHATAGRHRHLFKNSLLKFIGMLAVLRSLDVYGDLEIPGLEGTIARLVPGCTAGFHSLIPTWLLDAIDAGSVSPDDIRRPRIRR